jgi:hypothetical protein
LSEYPDDEDQKDNVGEAEPLSSEDRKVAGPIIDAYGEEVTRKIFSKTWQLREEGISEINDSISGKKKGK